MLLNSWRPEETSAAFEWTEGCLVVEVWALGLGLQHTDRKGIDV